jgi:acyl carrier protein
LIEAALHEIGQMSRENMSSPNDVSSVKSTAMQVPYIEPPPKPEPIIPKITENSLSQPSKTMVPPPPLDFSYHAPKKQEPVAPLPPPEPPPITQAQPLVINNRYQQLLVTIVSEKTGYPVEMLDLDMELEAALGIDSIKRVEILSALEEKIPELAGQDTSQMTQLRSLRAILDYLTVTLKI